ncbi:MAG: hypothetical protein PVF68_11915, partial [Acidobacteriota bacterium]
MRAERGRLFEILVVLVLAAAILAFGSTSFWAQSILAGVLAILFAAWWFAAGRDQLPAGFEPT